MSGSAGPARPQADRWVIVLSCSKSEDSAVVLRPLDSPRARLRALDVVARAAVRSIATGTYAAPTAVQELLGSCDGCVHAQGAARGLDRQAGRREMSLDWTGARVDGGPPGVPVGLPFQFEDIGVADGHVE